MISCCSCLTSLGIRALCITDTYLDRLHGLLSIVLSSCQCLLQHSSTSSTFMSNFLLIPLVYSTNFGRHTFFAHVDSPPVQSKMPLSNLCGNAPYCFGHMDVVVLGESRSHQQVPSTYGRPLVSFCSCARALRHSYHEEIVVWLSIEPRYLPCALGSCDLALQGPLVKADRDLR
jgi:hypothetical protein